jgi:hypothetical protein
MMVLLAAAILLPVTQTSTPKVHWKETTAADGSYSFELPAPAKVLNQTVETKRGSVEQTVHYCKVDGALYNVQRLKTAKPISITGEQAALDKARDEHIESTGSTVLREDRVSLGDHPGWDFITEGTLPGGPGVVRSRLRYYFVRDSYYILTVMSPRGKPLPKETTQFLESFRLTNGKPEAGGKLGAADNTRGRAVVKPGLADTPEQALRTFLIAMALKDEDTLRAVTLPRKDLEWLLRGQVGPAEQAEKMKSFIRRLPIRALKPGDRFTLPGNDTITVPPDEVTEYRAVLVSEGAPVPHRCYQVDGHWRIDATPIIAGRKAAESARAKDERSKK